MLLDQFSYFSDLQAAKINVLHFFRFVLLACLLLSCKPKLSQRPSPPADGLRPGGAENVVAEDLIKKIEITKETVAMDYTGRTCTLKKGQVFTFDYYMDERGDYVEFSAANPPEGCSLGAYFFLPIDAVKLMIDHPYIHLSDEERRELELQHFPDLGKIYPPANRRETVENNLTNATLHFPTQPCPIAPYSGSGSGGREFGAPRLGYRKHAAADLLADPDVHTKVIAITSGKVIDHYPFYQGTYATVVDHKDFIIRYGEVRYESRFAKLYGSQGISWAAGQTLGRVGVLYSGASMLHLEKYSGALSGPLSSWRYPYMRRGDLINPTEFVKKLEQQFCP